jgi:DnaJ domain
MLEAGIEDGLRSALGNIAALALYPVLPGLLLGYVRLSLTARRIRPAFSLQKYEASELDRALFRYDKVCCHITEIEQRAASIASRRRTLFSRRAAGHRHDADELEDLRAHASHLRSIVIELKRRPLRRLRAWLRVRIWRFALGGAVVGYSGCFMSLMLALPASQAEQLIARIENPLSWYPLGGYFFCANAVAAAFLLIAAPLLLVIGRARLLNEHSLELCALKAFADADPDRVMDQRKAEIPALGAPEQTHEQDREDNSWFKLLGLSHSATLEEVKEAYKTLVKQNHPDRVQGMSTAITKLAEAETKKLNMAYQYALLCIPSLKPS